MNSLFHYHITAWLVSKAGYSKKDSEIIAMSSAMVDYSVMQLSIESEGYSYKPAITHHFGFSKQSTPGDVWMPFHFFPQATNDSEAYQTKPKTEGAKLLLITALKSGNPYSIGIALHTFADTWAHQNFEGRESNYNRLLQSSPLPPLGHAHASRLPDIAGLGWIDPRNPEELIINGERFLQAARFMFRYLQQSKNRPLGDWDLLEPRLASILLPVLSWDLAPVFDDGVMLGHEIMEMFTKKNETLEARVLGIPDKELEEIVRALSNLEPFDARQWFIDALSLDSGKKFALLSNNTTNKAIAFGQQLGGLGKFDLNIPLEGCKNFKESHLYKWSEAAYQQRSLAQEFFASKSIVV